MYRPLTVLLSLSSVLFLLYSMLFMTISRPYELQHGYTTYPRHLPREPSIMRMVTSSSRLSLLIAVLALRFNPVEGTPIQAQEYNMLERRDDEEKSLSPTIWIPVLAGVLVLFCVALLTWKKASLRKAVGFFSLAGASPAGAPLGGATGGPRELTAEQLAGTINGQNVPPSTRNNRRARRPGPRRTPSQISVTSLPAYNKEPGAEELVIFRGRDMEDATMPAAVIMTAVDEDREGSTISHDNSQVSRYTPMPTTPNNMPLLRNDDTYGDLSLQSLQPLDEGIQRHSFDSSSHETSSLMHVDNNIPEGLPDPRGETPAYFEAVDADTMPNQHPLSESSVPETSASSGASESHSQRRSGFRTLLNRMSAVAHPQAHTRGESTSSALSSSLSHGAESSNNRASQHRTTPSAGSGSLLHSSMFRTLSRQKSINTLNSARLNSPSLISLNSISPPLTHTLVRTEITYPRSGPTAEQLKVISSRESFTRFGVPYGADAIAYAASTSRHDLLPPPDFETVASDSQSPRSAVGRSRLRSSSNAADFPNQSSAADASEPPPATSPDIVDAEPAEPSSPTLPVNSSNAETETHPAVPADSQPSSSNSKSHNSTSGKSSTEPRTVDSRSSPPPEQSSTRTVSEFGKLSAPPSSFYQDATGGSSRSQSAASMYSFETAAESLTASTPRRSSMSFVSADGSEVGSEPSTPRLGGQHTLEPTDATATPNAIKL